MSFIISAKTPCETLQKLRSRGITQNSDYMLKLEAACSQKNKLNADKPGIDNRTKVIGISVLIIGLFAALYLNLKNENSR